MSPTTLPEPTTELMTAEAFLELYPHGGYELVNGVVVECAMPYSSHGRLSAFFGSFLFMFVYTRDLGRVFSNDTFFLVRRNPDTVRGPDWSYLSYDRHPRGPHPEGLLPSAPDLAIEVRSPSDTWTEMFAKVGEYLGAGVRAVVIIDSERPTVSVYRPGGQQVVFGAGQNVTIEDVLPGFELSVDALFR